MFKEKVQYNLERKPTGINKENNGADIQLTRDGIVVLPNFFSSHQISRFIASIPQGRYTTTPEMQHSAANPLADKFIPNADNIPGLETFFKNADIERIIKSYFSESAIPGRNFVRTKKDTGPTASFENFYHFDSMKNRVKVFLYLTDVNIENAPVAYIKGTHETRLWRLSKEKEMYTGYKKNEQGYAKDDEASYIGCFWPHEIAQLIKTHPSFKEIICTGKAGTVIIFDAKGLHKASQLIEGERSILMSHWYIPNHHI